MKVTAACRDCGYAFEVDERHLGKPVQFTCPSCQTKQTVTAREKKVGKVVWDEEEAKKPSVILDEEEPAKPSVVFEDSPGTNPAEAPAAPTVEMEPERATEEAAATGDRPPPPVEDATAAPTAPFETVSLGQATPAEEQHAAAEPAVGEEPPAEAEPPAEEQAASPQEKPQAEQQPASPESAAGEQPEPEPESAGLQLEQDRPPADHARPAEMAVEQEAVSDALAQEQAEVQELQEEPVDISFHELEANGRYELDLETKRPSAVADADVVDDELVVPATPAEVVFDEEIDDSGEDEELLNPEVIEEPTEPRERLEAEIDAIDRRMAEIRREMSGTGAWNVEDAREVLEMPVEGWKAALRRWTTLVFSRQPGHTIPCRTGYDGCATVATPSRVREYKELHLRRHVLGGLAESRGLVPPMVLFTGPGLLAWLSLLFFVLLAQATTTVAPLVGALAVIPAVLAAVVLYRGLFLPLRQVLKQYPIWKPMGFSAPGRRIYRVLCILAIAACCLIVGLVAASNLIETETQEPQSQTAETGG